MLLTERSVFHHYDTYGIHSNGQPDTGMMELEEDDETTSQFLSGNFDGEYE